MGWSAAAAIVAAGYGVSKSEEAKREARSERRDAQDRARHLEQQNQERENKNEATLKRDQQIRRQRLRASNQGRGSTILTNDSVSGTSGNLKTLLGR